MSTPTREGRLLQTFARLADTLVDDYDVVELLQMLVDTCHDVLEMTGAGILLVDARGELEVIASTRESSAFIELMQLSADAGPCGESYTSGRAVAVPDLGQVPSRWQSFAVTALSQGFRAVDALPLRLRDMTIGTLGLLRSTDGPAPVDDMEAARAFADVATIGILHERAVREAAILSEQLQAALNSRVIIEQAKGVISQTRGVPIDEAFTLLRDHARTHRIGLSALAARIVDRSIEV